jgi:hypothetical protein
MADLFQEKGHTVGIAASGQRHPGVHASWDTYASLLTRDQFANWADRFDWVVWSEVQTVKLKIARSMRIKNALVVGPHRLTKDDLLCLPEYDRLLFFTRSALEAVVSPESFHGFEVVPQWDPGFPQIVRPAKEFWESMRYCISVGGLDDQDCRIAISAARYLLGQDPSAQVTLYSSKGTFPLKCLTALLDLTQSSHGRFEYRLRKDHDSHTALLAKQDWLIHLSCGDNVGVAVAEAFACGVPVVAFDVPPFSELIQDQVNGKLIECDLRFNDLQVPSAVPKLKSIKEALSCIAGKPDLLQACRDQLHRARNRLGFEQAIYDALV